jgi:hypothetical protein
MRLLTDFPARRIEKSERLYVNNDRNINTATRKINRPDIS